MTLPQFWLEPEANLLEETFVAAVLLLPPMLHWEAPPPEDLDLPLMIAGVFLCVFLLCVLGLLVWKAYSFFMLVLLFVVFVFVI